MRHVGASVPMRICSHRYFNNMSLFFKILELFDLVHAFMLIRYNAITKVGIIVQISKKKFFNEN